MLISAIFTQAASSMVFYHYTFTTFKLLPRISINFEWKIHLALKYNYSLNVVWVSWGHKIVGNRRHYVVCGSSFPENEGTEIGEIEETSASQIYCFVTYANHLNSLMPG